MVRAMREIMIIVLGFLFAQFASATCLKFDGFYPLAYCHGFSDEKSFKSGIKMLIPGGGIDLPETQFDPGSTIQIRQDGCEKVIVTFDQSASKSVEYTNLESGSFKSTIGNTGLVVSNTLPGRTQYFKIRKNIVNELVLVYQEVSTGSHVEVIEKRIRCAYQF